LPGCRPLVTVLPMGREYLLHLNYINNTSRIEFHSRFNNPPHCRNFTTRGHDYHLRGMHRLRTYSDLEIITSNKNRKVYNKQSRDMFLTGAVLTVVIFKTRLKNSQKMKGDSENEKVSKKYICLALAAFICFPVNQANSAIDITQLNLTAIATEDDPFFQSWRGCPFLE